MTDVESRDKKSKKTRGDNYEEQLKKLTDPCCCKEFELQTKYDLGKPRQKNISEMFEPRQQGSGKYKVAT
jgi:hypothetical protein